MQMSSNMFPYDYFFFFFLCACLGHVQPSHSLIPRSFWSTIPLVKHSPNGFTPPLLSSRVFRLHKPTVNYVPQPIWFRSERPWQSCYAKAWHPNKTLPLAISRSTSSRSLTCLHCFNGFSGLSAGLPKKKKKSLLTCHWRVAASLVCPYTYSLRTSLVARASSYLKHRRLITRGQFLWIQAYLAAQGPREAPLRVKVCPHHAISWWGECLLYANHLLSRVSDKWFWRLSFPVTRQCPNLFARLCFFFFFPLPVSASPLSG